MRIHLWDGPIKTTPAMLQFVHRHINASIGRFADRIDDVRVRLTDENGPKGPRAARSPNKGDDGDRCRAKAAEKEAADKSCMMIATMHSGEAVMAHEVGADHYTLIAAAANTLKRRLSRMRERSKTQRVGDRAAIADAPHADRLARNMDKAQGRKRRGC